MKFHFLVLLICFTQNLWGQQKNKILPQSLQKAYIVQKTAIVYARPDFDSLQIAKIPYGKRVTISREIFNARQGFGTFYQIFLSNPRKIKAYISEVDVIGSGQKNKEGKWIKNPKFSKTGDQIQKLENPNTLNEFTGDSFILLSQARTIGLSTTHFWKGYKRRSKRKSTWFFNLQLGGPGLPIKNMSTDISFGFAITRPAINGFDATKGYMLKLDLLLRFSMIDSSSFLVFFGLGGMAKLKGVLTGRRADGYKLKSEIGGGIASLLGMHIKLSKKLLLLAEGRFYYDILEKKFQPGAGGGFLVSF